MSRLVSSRIFSRYLSNSTALKASTAEASNTTEEMPDFRLEPSDSNRLTDIGTRRIFNEDHDQFREMARKWFSDVCSPKNHLEWEKQGKVPREVWEDAGAHGLLGCQTSDKYGGIGADVLHAAITWEEQSVANASGPGFALHSDIVMTYIENWGTEEQKHKYLGPMTEGKIISAIAMTEPGAGSDLQGIKTNAKPDGDDFILNGSKTFITNGQNADLVIVVAITNPKAKSAAHGISLVLVDGNMEGFKKGSNLQKLGLKAQDTSELFFEDVGIPKENILGGKEGLNAGFVMLMKELPQERLLVGSMAIARSESMFEITRDYIKDRKAFRKTLSDLQTIQHDMAHIKTELALGRAFTDQCIELHQNKKLTPVMASMQKYQMTEMQGRVLDKLLGIHGGYGYMWEYDICRAYADARVERIFAGTNEIMKEIIARDIVKK